MLEKIHSPHDLQACTPEELSSLADEIRLKIIDVVSKNGGHLSSNLGMVEATLVLHKEFDSPNDKILFDVGHQCYTHKLLTGRYDRFDTLRRRNGISGFPSREENDHDIMNEGHSGTSLSAALGIARANKLKGSDAYTVAVVGDGSLTNGMIYEALNNCAGQDLNLIVVINDNEMSISKNIGGLHDYLSKIRISKGYFNLKRRTEKVLMAIPGIGKYLAKGFKHIKDFFKLLFVKNNLFEDLGIVYLGPVDGHDMKKLSIVMEEAKSKHQCCIVHMKTVKGKGYIPAEREPDKYHSVSPFDPKVGMVSKNTPTFTSFVGAMLTKKADEDKRLCAITAAMRDGTGLVEFSEKHPDRFFDVGIAEEHAVTYAAGLAEEGMKPVLCLYSTFCQRACDQFIHDIAIQKLPLILMLDRSGLVPGDGITHQGIFDYSLLSTVPGTTIYSPETYSDLLKSFDRAYQKTAGLSVIRYPKGSENTGTGKQNMVDCGDFMSCSENVLSADVVIVTFGRLTSLAKETADMLHGVMEIGVVKLLQIFPVDTDKILKLTENAKLIYILEEGYLDGGLGEKVAAKIRGDKKVVIHAIPDFVQHGSVTELDKVCGFTKEDIIKRIVTELR